MTTNAPVPSHQDHSDIGASTMPRLIICPGSYRLAVAARTTWGGKRRSTIHSATGTVAHALIEAAITEGFNPVQELGEKVDVDGHEVEVDQDMIDGVQFFIDEAKQRTAGATWWAIETRVVLDSYWPAPGPAVSAFGTADLIAYHGLSLHLDIVDYKNGGGHFVDASSPQLFYYAAGALVKLREEGHALPVTIDMTIVQPNFRGQEKIRTYRTSTIDVLMWVDEVLKPTVAEAMAPGARLVASEHCVFCDAKVGCPALTAIRQAQARKDFGPNDEELVNIPVDELGEVLTDVARIEIHDEALRELAREKIEAGILVPGWVLVPSRPVRKWTGTGAEMELLLSEHGRSVLYDTPTPRSPAQLEKLLGPEDWEAIQPYVQSKSSGVRLVPDPALEKSDRADARDDFA